MADKAEVVAKIEAAHHAPEVTHIDSDEEEVAAEAIGGTNADLPPGYYRSPSFVGTIIVS